MSQPYSYPKVDKKLLDPIVIKILSAGSPQKSVMFGSRARGEHSPQSDLDLLIIEESDLPR